MNEQILLEARGLISRFLKDRRNTLGWSQERAAEESGLGIATIKRMEDDKFFMNMKQFLTICHAYSCYFFIEEKDSPNEAAKAMRERWQRKGDNN